MAWTDQPTWAVGTAAMLAVAMIVYHQSHHRLKISTTGLTQRTVDRITRLQAATDLESSDPPLLRKHSKYTSYTTAFATYPAIRTFYHPHTRSEGLPAGSRSLPLLVFIHGLGGSLAQFSPLLQILVNIAPCLGIDLPGSGLSKFDPKDWDAYSIDAMVALVAQVVQQHISSYDHQEVVLVGHSMGCSIAALLASTTSPAPYRLENIIGMIAICPKASPLSRNETWYSACVLRLPNMILNILRLIDRRGGINSPSVTRFVGQEAGPELRALQLRFNASLATAAWKRMAWGCLPTYGEGVEPHGGMPGRSVWSGIAVPLFLIAGHSDIVTKPEEVSKILSYLRDTCGSELSQKTSELTAKESGDASGKNVGSKESEKMKSPDEKGSHTFEHPPISESTSRHSAFLKTAILPPPASHALLYDPATHRTLAGLIEEFLSLHVSQRLDSGWQLQQLTTSGKWDVKNLKKWQGVKPVSEPLGKGIFRAMKTLRDQDEEHTPTAFAQRWRDKIYAVIDISHDAPVYDPKALSANGIQYHKFPTVSKIPPSMEEVRDFIGLVDRLRAQIAQGEPSDSRESGSLPAIATHCHYGYNRTGFLLVSYLIEREDYSIQDAIEEFERIRTPGIRHEHFIDTLFVRYCVGLKGT